MGVATALGSRNNGDCGRLRRFLNLDSKNPTLKINPKPNPKPRGRVPSRKIDGWAEQQLIWEFPKIRGTLFWGPYNKDPIFQGTILGSQIFGNSHLRVLGTSDSG